MGFQLVDEWQLAQGTARGPWGLVTLALGPMPTLTEELELLDDEDDEPELLLPDELALELLPDLPPGLEPAALALKKTLPPGIWTVMLASMGSNPRAMVISQRERCMFSPC